MSPRGAVGIGTGRLAVGDRPPEGVGRAAVQAALEAGARWIATSDLHGAPGDRIPRGLAIVRGVPPERIHLEVGLTRLDGLVVQVAGVGALLERVDAALTALGVHRVGRLVVVGARSVADAVERVAAVRALGVADAVGLSGVPARAIGPAEDAEVVCGRLDWRGRWPIRRALRAEAVRTGRAFVGIDPSDRAHEELDPRLIRAAALAGVAPHDVAIAWARRVCDAVLVSPSDPAEARAWVAPDPVGDGVVSGLVPDVPDG